jgi:choline-sulfatase
LKLGSRVLFSMSGATLGALFVSALECGRAEPRLVSDGYAAFVAGIFPLAVVLAIAVTLLGALLDPSGPRNPFALLQEVRERSVFVRTRQAAVGPLFVFAFFASLTLSVHFARSALSAGLPQEAGAVVALGSLLLTGVCFALSLSLVSPIRRLNARLTPAIPQAADPVFTTVLALLVCFGLFALGLSLGDTSGDRVHDAPPSFGLFVYGVFKRRELDLRPAAELVIICMTAFWIPRFFARARPVVATLAACMLPLLCGVLVLNTAKHLRHTVGTSIEQVGGLSKVGLSLLRRATDRDHDGASAYFDGGDCNDSDPAIGPNAVDIPGNGVDEDCSGADLPIAAPVVKKVRTEPAPSLAVSEPFNVLLITIDTLRADVGYAGYPKPISPNLDRLASQSTVYEQAYSFASYTGKSIAPLLIGRYPSETFRDGNHFNTYMPANMFVSERAKEAGFHTMGISSLWYFAPWSGISQGFDVWDLSAKPPGGGEKDNSTTSDKVTDAAIARLKENAGAKFFTWVHYLDPHAEYLPHKEAPDFRTPEDKTAIGDIRAKYDGEVWFTDREVGRLLDYVVTQDWGKHTAIIVTADHGEAFGDHNMSWHGREIWESLVRVPLLIYVPGAAAHRIKQKRGHIDLVPTFLDLMKIAPASLPGESLIPEVLGAAPVERDVYVDMPVGPFNGLRRALIHGDSPGLKLLHFGGNQYSLYDLANDPQETSDLAKDETLLRPMVDTYQQMRASTREIDVKPVAPP